MGLMEPQKEMVYDEKYDVTSIYCGAKTQVAA